MEIMIVMSFWVWVLWLDGSLWHRLRFLFFFFWFMMIPIVSDVLDYDCGKLKETDRHRKRL